MFEKRMKYYLNNENRSSDFSGYTTDNIRRAAVNLGSPHSSFKSILITGTNGKGTVATYLHALIQQSGIKCGLFTSPHLIRINERIKINHEIDDSEAIDIINEIEKSTSGIHLTYFDMLTLIAFVYFRKKMLSMLFWKLVLVGLLIQLQLLILFYRLLPISRLIIQKY
jgi:dihydrofolate synthase/folylpolyglutamate synthase